MAKPIMITEKGWIWRLLSEQPEFWGALGGMVLGQASLSDGLRPFALSWLAVTLLHKRRMGVASAGGMLVSLAASGLQTVAVCEMTLVCVLLLLFWPERWRQSLWLAAPIAVASANLLCKSIFYLAMPFDLTLLDIGIESILAGLFVLVAHTALVSVKELWRWSPLTLEEKISWFIFGMALLLGLDKWQIAGLDLQSICSRAVVLAAASLAGSGGGAAVGVAAGLVPALANGLTTASVGFYGVAGLLGGVFRSVGRWGVWIGFLAGNLFMMFCFGSGTQFWLTILETTLAGMVYAALPLSLTTTESLVWQPNCKVLQNEGEQREKIARMSRMFIGLSEELQLEPNGVEDLGDERLLDELEGMYQRLYAQVCQYCPRHKRCWQREKQKIFQEIRHACDYLEKRGIRPESAFSEEFHKVCPHTAQMEVALINQIDLIKGRQYYQEQMRLAKEMVAKHLASLGQAAENLAKDNDYARQAEKKIMMLSSREHLSLEKVRVYENSGQDWEIAVQIRYFAEETAVTAFLQNRLSKWMKRSYQVAELFCQDRDQGLWQARLVPEAAPQISLGAAVQTKSDSTISGDSWQKVQLSPGKTAIILSDGMGSGEDAKRQSGTTVKLLEQLLLGGVHHQLALEIVNAVLLLRSEKESFATVDLALLDTVEKQIECIKIGAVPSFLKRQKQVKAFQSATLPVGILNEVDTDKQSYPLEVNDLLIMMSDGVFEAYPNGLATWQEIIADLPTDEPQLAAEYLLALAISCYDRRPADDLTVLVMRIEDGENNAEENLEKQ